MEDRTPGKETFPEPGPRRLTMHTVVIGAGWAGLAAAVELARSSHQVTLLEGARQAGGRARRVSFADLHVDNGQHLLIGAYQKTLQLITAIGLDEAAVFERRPLELFMRHSAEADRHIRMQAAALPAPLHMLFALTTATGLSMRERGQALRLCAALPRLHPYKQTDISVSDLLQRYRQSSRLINELWEPLCLAIMNTPISTASARIFIRVLMDAFMQRRHDSDLLIPRRDLGSIIPDPAIDTIRQLGGTVYLGSKVRALTLNGQRATAVIMNDDTVIEADQVIIATPPRACQRLLEDHAVFTATVEQLRQLESAPICTLYLQYPPHVSADRPMTGLTGTIGQWLFDRRICGQQGLMAVVISGHGEHETLDNDTLAQQIGAELAHLYPHWPAAERVHVIREQRATFVCHSAVHAHRPGHQIAADNVWLAGDYTDTGYPATLEGAIRSGLHCASAIMQEPG
jgi:squalene-associated FAD-dependent desaturase